MTDNPLLDATTLLDIGDQKGPSPTTTLEDVREDSGIEYEIFYLRIVRVVSKGSFLVTLLVNHDFVPIKIPKIAGII